MAKSKHSGVILGRYPLFLQAVEQVLTRVGITTVGKTTSPDRALALVEQRQPDVLVTEIEMTEEHMDGISCLREACKRSPRLRAIVLAAHDDPDRIEAAFEAGAAAYVVKTVHPEDLATAVRQTFRHSVYLGHDRDVYSRAEAGKNHQPEQLTPREREILQLASEGYTNGELARMLWVTEQTVKFHLSNVYKKLNVSNRTEASRWAQRHHLIREGSGAPGSPADARNGAVRLLRSAHSR